MRRITIITGLVAAALATAPAAHAARPLARAVAEPVAVRHIQVNAQNKAAYGLYDVTNTSYRCQPLRGSGFSCNFALFLRGLMPQATEQVCLSTVEVVRSRAGRVVTQHPARLVCG
jgi:hypothetical protein